MKVASKEYRLSVQRQTKDNVKEAMNVTMKPVPKRAAIYQIGNKAKQQREDHAATTSKCAYKQIG